MKKIFVVLLSITFVMLLCACATSTVEMPLNFMVDDVVYYTFKTSGRELIKLPDNPTKEGFLFGGWFWDEDNWQDPLTVNSLLDAPLSSEMQVYAKWIVIQEDELPVEGTIVDQPIEENDFSLINEEVGEVRTPDTSSMVQDEKVEEEENVLFLRNYVMPREPSHNPAFGFETTYYDYDGYAISMYYLGKILNYHYKIYP